MVAKISAYIGLHAEKTGPSAAPVRMYPSTPDFFEARPRSLFELFSRPIVALILAQRRGNRRLIPRIMTINPDADFHTCGSTPMRTVLALRIRVKSRTEMPRLIEIM
jgi:hypothetical protein